MSSSSTPAGKFPPDFFPQGLRNCEIRPGEEGGKGLGIFATKDIPKGRVILVEVPLMISADEKADKKGPSVEEAYNALTPEQKAIYRSLYAYRPENRILKDSFIKAIFFTNGFEIGKPIDYLSGVFVLASRFNHSCVPNCHFQWVEGDKTTWKGKEIETPDRMVFTSYYKVLKGEEVTIDYGLGPKGLMKNYGFKCECPHCSEPFLPRKFGVFEGSAPEPTEEEKLQYEKEKLFEENERDWARKKRRSLP